MYALELIGFGNFSREEFETLEEARTAWSAAKMEDTLRVYSSGKVSFTGSWSSWELLKDGKVHSEGTF